MSPHAEAILRGSALARFVPADHFEQLRDRFEEVRYDFGDVIMRAGEEADAFYILVNGRVRVLTEGAGGAAPRWSIGLPDDSAQQALWYEVTR